ncbi:MAG TPA: hypothetical protein VI818_01025 [Candidatus Thermoplasmatota archaeon]|nr:hypothetical protein [Candidatus Thermoplasmatota archaeon]
MRSLFVALLIVGVATTALSGCLETKTTAYHAYGSKGSLAYGFAYGGGKSILPIEAPAFLDVNDEANSGIFVVKGKAAGQDIEVHFEHFAQSKPFHDGGLAANFREHGASGVGDKSIPEVDLDMAGWGHATYTVGGKAQKDITGNETWIAHFMVIRNGVRDDATGAIWADVNKTQPYNPAEPAMGLSTPGDWELHLVLKNQTSGNTTGAQAFGPINFRGTPSNAASQTDRLFTGGAALGGVAFVYLNVTGTATAASNVTFVVKGPGGSEIVRQAVGRGGMPSPMQVSQTRYFKQVSFPITEAGDYSISATGTVAPGGGYDVKGVAIPPASQVINFWWEDLIFGEDAETTAHDKGVVDEDHMHGLLASAT